MFRLQKPLKSTLKRCISTTKMILEHLNERTLIRVSGNEVSDYLQGLITNDIKHLNNSPGSMYGMFLNTKGRILYDTIIYRPLENQTFFIECDKSITQQLQKHLKLYRVRRKIDIVDLYDEYKIFALFNPYINNSDNNRRMDGLIVPCDRLNGSLPQNFVKIHRDLTIYKDPRIIDLGSRIIVKTNVNIDEQINEITQLDNESTNHNYRWLRYSLGVGEGIEDIPPNISFPLECNCDYLHGVSFHKGCYIGQELTARVHHTGVVRKRLMPIKFIKIPTQQLHESDVIFQNENLGKLRGIESDVGLGLFRIEKVLKFDKIQIGDNGVGTVFKPNWWPIEAPKDKITAQKFQ